MRASLALVVAAALHAAGVEARRQEKVLANSQATAKEAVGLRPGAYGGGTAHSLHKRSAGVKHKVPAAHAAKPIPRQHLRTQAGTGGEPPAILASTDSEGEQGEVAAGLGRELKEVEQNRANVKELQQALSSQVALLRESAALQRASSSAHGRAAAARQVRRSEQLVKDTSALLKESREDAAEEARAVLRETGEVRSMLNTLSTEAREALQSFAAPHAHDDGAADARSMPEPSSLPSAGANETQPQDLDFDDPEDDAEP